MFVSSRSAGSAECPQALIVTIDTQQTADPVSKYLFGSFIEHIGTLIYRSIWAELLDDRKFYFPISSKDPEPPRTQSGNPMRQQLRKWRPIGPDELSSWIRTNRLLEIIARKSLSMPRLLTAFARPDFSADQRQAVHRSDLSAWDIGNQGEGLPPLGRRDNDKQTASFTLTKEYKKFPFSFSAKARLLRCHT